MTNFAESHRCAQHLSRLASRFYMFQIFKYIIIVSSSHTTPLNACYLRTGRIVYEKYSLLIMIFMMNTDDYYGDMKGTSNLYEFIDYPHNNFCFNRSNNSNNVFSKFKNG